MQNLWSSAKQSEPMSDEFTSTCCGASCAMRNAWLFPHRDGVGRNAFLYNYDLPRGKPKSRHHGAKRCLQVEGKLTFPQYVQLVAAVDNGAAFGAGKTPVMESWLPFDPLNNARRTSEGPEVMPLDSVASSRYELTKLH